MPQVSPEIAVTLKDLLKLEYLVIQRRLVPEKQVHSILAGKNISKLRGRGLDFEEVRKYVSGDDIRNIDWKVTARTRVTHTKVFTEEKERPVFTIVDLSSGMFFGSVKYTKSVIASQLAAISAFRTLKIGDRFGGLIFNEERDSYIAPKRSRGAVLRYLEQVVHFGRQLLNREQIKPSGLRLNEVLKRAYASITHDYVITIISDFTHVDEEARRLLINLAQHNDVILVQITDPFEANVPQSSVLLSDGQKQLSLKPSKDLKGKLETVFEDQRSFFKELRKFGIVHMEVNTTSDVEAQLKELFRR